MDQGSLSLKCHPSPFPNPWGFFLPPFPHGLGVEGRITFHTRESIWLFVVNEKFLGNPVGKWMELNLLGSSSGKVPKTMNVAEGNPFLPAGRFQTEVDHFWVAPSLCFRRESMCEAIDRSMIFCSHANRTHMKDFALCLVLKVRVFGTPNWPITSMAEFFGLFVQV